MNDSATELPVLLSRWRESEAGNDVQPASVYQHFSKQFLAAGAANLCTEVARNGLDLYPQDPHLRQLLGLALARTGATRAANQLLSALFMEGHRDSETLGILARTHKDVAFASNGEEERQSHLQKALDIYLMDYRQTGAYWTGINAASLSRLLGDRLGAVNLARDVNTHCLAAMKESGGEESSSYWLLATLGEAALNMEDLGAAERWYRSAYRVGKSRFGDLNSTRRQAKRLLQFMTETATLVDAWLPIPRVVVFSGHMIDRAERPVPRFPQRLQQPVFDCIKNWLDMHQTFIGFSSAACGADILFQEALQQHGGGESHIVLPYDTTHFIQDSVDIDDTPEWRDRFHQVTGSQCKLILASREKVVGSEISYQYANDVLFGLARLRAAELETECIGLAVWDGKTGDGAGGTASCVASWLGRAIPVHQIDIAQRPHTDQPLVVRQIYELPSGVSIAPPPNQGVRVMSMLFADTVGFSKLSENQVAHYVQVFLGAIARLLKDYAGDVIMRNSWGDAIYLVFDSVRRAGCFALDLCELINSHPWPSDHLPDALNLRIALHAGPVLDCVDPIIGRQNFFGSHVSHAARLEPSTPIGQVYASEAYAALTAIEGVEDFECRYVQQLDWAKHYGSFPTYVLTRGGVG